MTEDTHESGRRERLDETIADLEREKNELEDRLDNLRYQRLMQAIDAGEAWPGTDARRILLACQYQHTDGDASGGVSERDLLGEMERRGMSRREARAEYEAAERRGLLFEVDGRVRPAERPDSGAEAAGDSGEY
jgi:hypothetical protein